MVSPRNILPEKSMFVYLEPEDMTVYANDVIYGKSLFLFAWGPGPDSISLTSVEAGD